MSAGDRAPSASSVDDTQSPAKSESSADAGPKDASTTCGTMCDALSASADAATSAPICGNATVEAGEDCDDGNDSEVPCTSSCKHNTSPTLPCLCEPDPNVQDSCIEKPFSSEAGCEQCIATEHGWNLANLGTGMGASWEFDELDHLTQLSASVGQDLWGMADSAVFAYRAFSGDVTISVRIQEVVGSEFTKGGVMFRESLDPGSRSAAQLVHANGYDQSIRRPSPCATTEIAIDWMMVPTPSWARLQREGNRITFSNSEDGEHWNTKGTREIDFNETILVGIGYSKHAAGEYISFDNLEVTQP